MNRHLQGNRPLLCGLLLFCALLLSCGTPSARAADASVSAPLSASYTVRLAEVANGSLQTTARTAASGSVVGVTAIPNVGYTTASVTVRDINGNLIPLVDSGGSYAFTMPGETVIVSAVFTAPTYRISPLPLENGKLSVLPMIAAAGSTVTITALPDKGYAAHQFAAWDAAGNALTVTETGGGNAVFVMPSGDVQVSAVFEVERLAEYLDVDTTKWFYDENRIMMGIDARSWAPDEPVSTATAVVTLARLCRMDLTEFSDDTYYSFPWIPQDWYTAAARWAAASGFLNERLFTGREPLPRAGLAVMLRNFLTYRGVETALAEERVPFTDEAQVNALGREASDAFQVLYRLRIFGGYTDGSIRPYNTTTRAQMAALLHRLSLHV